MWREFRIKIPDDTIKEQVLAALYELECQGVAEEEGLLIAYFQAGVEPSLVSEALSVFSGVESSCEEVQEQDWYASWKGGIRPFRAAGILICPPWEVCEPGPDELTIILDPGQAFGTGDHVTTATVLGMLKGWASLQGDLGSRRFLDLGTGTGILSVAAVLLGIADVTAVDVETDAIRTASRNIALNGMQERISLIHGSIKEAGRGYDFIAANIFQEVLLELMPGIVASLNEGGRVAVSGLLDGQEGKVVESAKAAGLEVVEVVHGSGWVSVLFQN